MGAPDAQVAAGDTGGGGGGGVGGGRVHRAGRREMRGERCAARGTGASVTACFADSLLLRSTGLGECASAAPPCWRLSRPLAVPGSAGSPGWATAAATAAAAAPSPHPDPPHPDIQAALGRRLRQLAVRRGQRRRPARRRGLGLRRCGRRPGGAPRRRQHAAGEGRLRTMLLAAREAAWEGNQRLDQQSAQWRPLATPALSETTSW